MNRELEIRVRRLAAIAVVFAMGLAGRLARAEEPTQVDASAGAAESQTVMTTSLPAGQRTRLELGFRSGIGLPAGDVQLGSSLNSSVSQQLPLWFDLGARIKSWSIGGYFSYGVTSLSQEVNDACEADAAAAPGIDIECNASDVRVGFASNYHARVTAVIEPWFGTGIGWEWLSISESLTDGRAAASVDFGLNGLELLLQGGIDFFPTPTFALGPFVSFARGHYFTQSLSCDNCSLRGGVGSSNIGDSSIHYWLFLGLSLRLLL